MKQTPSVFTDAPASKWKALQRWENEGGQIPALPRPKSHAAPRWSKAREADWRRSPR